MPQQNRNNDRLAPKSFQRIENITRVIQTIQRLYIIPNV